MAYPEQLGLLIGYCGRLGKQHLDNRLRQFDVTPVQAAAMRCLRMAPCEQEVTQRDLEHRLGLKASTINGVVDRMVEKNLITRTPRKSDARCRVLQLTDKGRTISEQIDEAVQQTEQVYRSLLSEKEYEEIREMLIRLITNFEKIEKEVGKV